MYIAGDISRRMIQVLEALAKGINVVDVTVINVVTVTVRRVVIHLLPVVVVVVVVAFMRSRGQACAVT